MKRYERAIFFSNMLFLTNSKYLQAKITSPPTVLYQWLTNEAQATVQAWNVFLGTLPYMSQDKTNLIKQSLI
jgi:hypothetical protein